MYYCIAPNGRKSYVPKWLYEKRKRSKQHKVGVEDSAPPVAEYPKPDESGSWYTLSNGKRVNGEANAIKAQQSLNG